MSAAVLATTTLAALAVGAVSTGAGAAKATKSSINIGIIATLSGPNAPSSIQAQIVGKAYAAWKNANGGINGHPIKLFIEDDQSSPTAGLTAAQNLVQNDHVIAIVGGTDNVIPAWDTYVASQDIPIIGGAQNSQDWYNNPDLFATSEDNISGLDSQVAVAAQYGHAKKFANLYCAEITACGQAGIPLQAAATKAGIGYTALAISSSAPSYTAQCLTLQQQGVDYAQLNFAAAAGVRFIQSCQAQGYNPSWGTSMQAFAVQMLTVPNVKAFGPSYVFNPAMGSPTAKTFTAVMKKYVKNDSWNGGPAPWTWDAFQVTSAALAKVTGAYTGANLKTALYSLNGSTLNGELANPLTFTPGKPSVSFLSKPCGFVMGMAKQKLSAPAGAKKICVS